MRTQADLSATACSLVGRGKGILVLEGGAAVLAHRLAGLGIIPSGANVAACRRLVLTTPGLAAGLGGVVLAAESLDDTVPDGDRCPAENLRRDGVLLGVAADTGRVPMPGPPGQALTDGLDGLRGRLTALAARGIGFATWRALFPIGDGLPSWSALRTNTARLARFAEVCQQSALVPVLEIAVPADGTHGSDLCEAISSLVLVQLVEQLHEHDVALDATVLAPTLVVPGRRSGESTSPRRAARATVRTLRRTVPAEIAGVAVQTSGLPATEATAHLAAVRALATPWPVTFTFGNALLDPLLLAWRGRRDQSGAGQRELGDRLRALELALRGPDHRTALPSPRPAR